MIDCWLRTVPEKALLVESVLLKLGFIHGKCFTKDDFFQKYRDYFDSCSSETQMNILNTYHEKDKESVALILIGWLEDQHVTTTYYYFKSESEIQALKKHWKKVVVEYDEVSQRNKSNEDFTEPT
jgi:hypothetical protein